MENSEKLLIIDEIEVEYQKLFNECKPKHEQVKAGLDEGLNILSQLKESPLDEFDNKIKESIEKLINPIILIAEKKVKRIYVTSLVVLQKIISNSLITKEQSSSIIISLTKISEDSSEEFVHQKIIEALSPLIDINIIEIKKEIIESIINIILKIFQIKGTSFKVSLPLLIDQLLNILCKLITDELNPIIKDKKENLLKEIENNIINDNSKENEIKKEEEPNENENNKEEAINEEIGKKEEGNDENNKLKDNNYFIPPKFNLEGYEESEMIKSLLYIFQIACDLSEGKKLDNVYKSIYTKCLGYEIITSLIKKTNDLFIYFPSIMSRINDSLHQELLKRFGKAYDYFTCIKITRLAVILMQNLQVGYDYIPFFIKYAENVNLGWQKQIGIEAFGELLSNTLFLSDLFTKNIALYETLFNSLFKISNDIIEHCKKKNTLMNLKKNELNFENIINERIILKDEIIFSYEKEPKLQIIHENIYAQILQCYISLFNSFENFCNNKDNFERKNIVQILGFQEKQLLNIIINLCQYSEEGEIIDKFMNILVSIIKSLSVVDLKEIRNLYLEEIEKLLSYGINTFKSNQEINMTLELEDKIMNIIFRMFNEIPEVFDKEGFTLLLSCLHKIYLKILKSEYNLLINPNEEYEINIYIRLFEEHLKHYSKIKDLPQILEEDKTNNNNDTTIKEVDEENEESNKNNTIIKTEEEKKTNEETEKKKNDNNSSGGGFFGTFKYMLGLSKKNEVNFEEQAIIEKQKKDMYHKLSDNLNEIFLLNSTSLSKESLINIINALLQSSIEIMEQNKDNQVALLNFNLTKFFELLIVNLDRFNLIWNAFVKIASDITTKQIKKISHFSVDIITISIIFILNMNLYREKNSKDEIDLIPQDVIFSALSDISSKNISQDINLNIIYNINFLLSNITKLFDTNGWTEFFKTIHNLIIYQDEAQNENCFSILERIFDNYLNSISPENISVISDIIESFISYKKNDIISKESLEKLDRLSILCEKFQPYIYMTDFNKEEIKLNSIQKKFFVEKYDTKEKRLDYFDTIWKTIFSKLLNLSLDDRKDIRELIINKFTKIFVKRCRSISPKSSLEIIKNNFFENFCKIYSIYESKLKHNKEVLELKKEQILKEKREEKQKREFVIGNLVALDLVKRDEEKESEEIEEKIRENDTEKDQKKIEEKSWEETLQVSVRSISEIIPAFLETNPNLGYEYYKENIFKLIGDKFKEPMKFISPKVSIEILKCIYLISQGNKLLFYKYFESFLDIYHEMNLFISSEFFLKSFPKLSVECNMIKEIINNLKLVFCNKEFHPIMHNQKIFNTMMETIKSLIVSSINNEGTKAKKQMDNLLKDEEVIFNFVNEVQNLILKYNYDFNKKKENEENEDKNIKIDLEQYENEINEEIQEKKEKENEINENYVDTEIILISFTEFLISYLLIDINNLHSEALCRKSLEQFVTFYTNELLPISVTQKTLPLFITKCRDLILLRQKSELVSTIFTVKEELNKRNEKLASNYNKFGDNNNIFFMGRFSTQANYSKEKFSQQEKELIWQYASEKLIKILTYVIVQNNKEQNYEKYNIEEIWKVIIEAYDMIFRQRDSLFKNMKKSHKELVSKSSSEMKISIINFIVNILLPNSLHISKQMQIRLLILLDIGSSLESESNNESSGSVASSISKVCISNLFELCRFKTPEVLKREINVQNFNPDDYVKIKEKIAKMCTPILIKRCKEILKKFLSDEIKSGAMPLSRSRLEDIKYVLDKLKKLEIYPDYNKIEDMKEKKDENKIEENNEQQEIIGFILKKKKSHLISLLPLLSEFITTKENEIKILVKDIFKIISNELGIK